MGGTRRDRRSSRTAEECREAAQLVIHTYSEPQEATGSLLSRPGSAPNCRQSASMRPHNATGFTVPLPYHPATEQH
jgi:hypothetical protein